MWEYAVGTISCIPPPPPIFVHVRTRNAFLGNELGMGLGRDMRRGVGRMGCGSLVGGGLMEMLELE